MADETLLSAARRVVRFFRIDMQHGGLVSVETQHAVEILDKEVLKEQAKEKANAERSAHPESDGS